MASHVRSRLSFWPTNTRQWREKSRLHQNWLAVLVDVANAFKCVGRSAVFSEVHTDPLSPPGAFLSSSSVAPSSAFLALATHLVLTAALADTKLFLDDGILADHAPAIKHL